MTIWFPPCLFPCLRLDRLAAYFSLWAPPSPYFFTLISFSTFGWPLSAIPIFQYFWQFYLASSFRSRSYFWAYDCSLIVLPFLISCYGFPADICSTPWINFNFAIFFSQFHSQVSAFVLYLSSSHFSLHLHDWKLPHHEQWSWILSLALKFIVIFPSTCFLIVGS